MRIAYCDRCGVEHREGEKGGRVVTVSFSPLHRTQELCGACRSDFMSFLDDFVLGKKQEGTVNDPTLRQLRKALEMARGEWCVR